MSNNFGVIFQHSLHEAIVTRRSGIDPVEEGVVVGHYANDNVSFLIVAWDSGTLTEEAIDDLLVRPRKDRRYRTAFSGWLEEK